MITLSTNLGNIVLELDAEKAPITVENFLSYAKNGYYNGTIFHRVIDGFMIQGGDPQGNGSGNPGYAFKDEFTDLKFEKGGVLAMANSGPTTNGSQFFITHKDTPWLNGKHTIFGHVVEKGMEVVNKIVQDDVILKMTITRKGAAAKAFDAPKVFADYYNNKAEDDKKQAEQVNENLELDMPMPQYVHNDFVQDIPISELAPTIQATNLSTKEIRSSIKRFKKLYLIIQVKMKN